MKALDVMRAIRECDATISATNRLVLLAIALRCDSTKWRCGKYAPALSTLARDCNLTRRTLQRAIKELEAMQLLTVHRWHGLTSDYQLHIRHLAEFKRPATLYEERIASLEGSDTESHGVRHNVTGGVTQDHTGGDTVSQGVRHSVTHSAQSDESAQQGTVVERSKVKTRSRRNGTPYRVPPAALMMVLRSGGVDTLDAKERKAVEAMGNAKQVAQAAALAHVTALCTSHESPPRADGVTLWRMHSDTQLHNLLLKALDAGGGFIAAKTGDLSSGFAKYLDANS